MAGTPKGPRAPHFPFQPREGESQLDRIERKLDGLAHAFASFLEAQYPQGAVRVVDGETLARERLAQFIAEARNSGEALASKRPRSTS